MAIDASVQDRFVAKMRTKGEYSAPKPVEKTRLDVFMEHLNAHGEEAAIAKYGDPQYWDQCRHGQWHCRYGGRKHAKSACIHEDAPQHECTTPTQQLGLFGAGL